MSVVRPDPERLGFRSAKGTRRPLARALLAGLIAAPLALFSGAYSLAVALDTSEPQVSRALYGELPKAKVRLGDLAISDAFARLPSQGAAPGVVTSPPPSASDLAASLPQSARLRIEAQALSSLSDTPYAGGALRQLAFVETDPQRRRLLLGLARDLSRRDVSTAAQAAELQLLDGKWDEGLATLEGALTISDTLDAQIFPIMLRASRLPEFNALLRASFARAPAWTERLARHASEDLSSAPQFARIADGFPAGSRALSIDYGAPLVDRLAMGLRPAEAFAAYDAYSPLPQDPARFGTGALPPLDWRLIDNLETGARLLGRPTPSRPAVAELFAKTRRAGEVARIMLRLEPGRHALTLSLSDPRGSDGRIVLTRVCVGQGRELGAQSADVALAGAIENGTAALAFDVPAGCPFQSLRLGIRAGREDVSVLIDAVALGPVDPETAAATPLQGDTQ